MKTFKFSGSIFLIVLTALMLTTSAFAWGPERPTYTNEEPADHAVFNSITNNAAVGDERDFVRVAEKGTGDAYASDIEIEAGKQYEVYIYYDNDASPTFNDAEHEYIGVARDVRLSTIFPGSLEEGEQGAISGKISSSNTDPQAVWDEAYITAKESVTLHYVTGSAKIYNQGSVNDSVLSSTHLFSDEGALLGIDELNGIIPCNDEYASGHIVYTIQTEAAEENQAAADPPEAQNAAPGVILIACACLLTGVFLGVFFSRRSRR